MNAMNEQQLKEALADARTDPEAAELQDLLFAKLHAVPPRERRNAWWVMSQDFFDNLRAKFPGARGDPYWVLGKKVVIRDDATEPRIESCPVDWVIIERTRISQAALKTAEDGIISMAELMSVIWTER